MKLCKKTIKLLLIVSFVIFLGFSAEAASEQITLSVLYEYSIEAARDVIEQSLDEYQRIHPNIKLNIQTTTQRKWPEIMATLAVAKDFPDVSTCVPQRVGQWAAKQALASGNEYIPKTLLDKYSEVRLLPDTYNGQIYGLPYFTHVRIMAYNKDYFDKAGIVPPKSAKDAWTWEEMVEAAKKAQAASGAKYALQFEKPSFDSWLPTLYQAGGQLMTDDFSKSALNTPQVRRALEWTAKLHREGIAAPGLIEGTEDPKRLFASGMTTLWMPCDSLFIEAIKDQIEFEIGITFLPKDVIQATAVGGTEWVAFKGEHPKEAWDLILFLTGKEATEAICDAVHLVPPRSDAEVDWMSKVQDSEIFSEQAKQTPDSLIKQQITPAYAACRDKLLQELAACVSGQKSVDETLAAMDRIMNEAIKEYH